MKIRIPVFTDDPGWHGERLKQAFAVHGWEAVFVSLRQCHLGLVDGKPGVHIDGFDQLPVAAFVRGIAAGTMQQVIQRLNILHMLSALGVVVYNHGRAVERTVDKAMTSFLLHQHQVPTPATWVCETRQLAHKIIQQETQGSRALVIKPLFGAQGQGVRKLQADSPLPVPMELYIDGVYYLQRYIDSGEDSWHDYRVFIINDQVVGAMLRHGQHWVSNVAQGGQCAPVTVFSELAEIALAAAHAVNIDYCGVDIIQDRQGGLQVLEINSIPAWKGLQSVVDIDIAQALVTHVIARTESVHATRSS